MMISRVAESCFWLLRHLERLESTAQLLRVNRSFVLDIDLPEVERWYPLVVVVGEKKRFNEVFDIDAARHDGELVEGFLTWDQENPVSIRNSLYWARENARTIREVISLDMWEELNTLWHWLSGGQGKRLYRSNRDRFYRHLVSSINAFHGVTYNTLSHEAPFDFMQLGMHLERAGQTARILDVKYHAIGPTRAGIESAIETAQWMALLRSCSAQDAFFKVTRRGISGAAVFEYLVKDPNFPRSILYSLMRSSKFLERIKPPDCENQAICQSEVKLKEVVAHLTGYTIDQFLETGIHKELTFIVDSTTAVCSAVTNDFFSPEVPEIVADSSDLVASGK